jgi:hypothetical protein
MDFNIAGALSIINNCSDNLDHYQVERHEANCQQSALPIRNTLQLLGRSKRASILHCVRSIGLNIPTTDESELGPTSSYCSLSNERRHIDHKAELPITVLSVSRTFFDSLLRRSSSSNNAASLNPSRRPNVHTCQIDAVWGENISL